MSIRLRRSPLRRAFLVAALSVAALVGIGPARRAAACPFCSAVSLTFAQEIAQSQAAVIARLVEPPAPGSLGPRAEGPLPKGKFAVVEVLKGGDLVAEAGHGGADGPPIETILLEEKPVGTLFLLMAVEPPKLVWSSPIPVSPRAVEYIRALGGLPEKGPDRLAFFQRHLEDADETLARDAYDEFAVAPYADVRGLADRMDSGRLLEWIENPKVQANRRRLYATMLGTCGTPRDADRIAQILANENLGPDKAESRNGLDALIACYVTLRGPEGLDLVDRLFLERKGREIPFTETYAAVMALRFLGEESDKVPRERVLTSLRLLLQEPKLADLVIADLARWQDWSVIDRLVELFEQAEADNIFVREPIVNYLRACPLPKAAEAIAKLEKIDPEAVRRAATLAAFAGAAAAPAATGTSAAPPAIDPEGDAGDPTNGGPRPTVPATGPEAALPPATAGAGDLAARIPAVLGDEDATDDAPGVDPSRPTPAARASSTQKPQAAAPGGASLLKWAIWAGLVLAIAAFARAKLRPVGATAARRSRNDAP
jgi:hypothetical protein